MKNSDIQHTIVYGKEGRFAGWPANYGMWSWGDEIVVVFTEGTFLAGVVGHKRDKSKPFTTMIGRSTDGGVTWQVEPMQLPGAWTKALSAEEHQVPELQNSLSKEKLAPVPVPDDVDFTKPDFALMCGRTGLDEGAVSWFYISQDRCRTWSGPHELPLFDLPGVAARTDYTILGPRQAILMLTGVKRNGSEGVVFCAETQDGGRSFRLKSMVGPEPDGYRIMSSTVQLSNKSLLTAVRCRESRDSARRHGWIDLYRTDDLGESWELKGPVVDYTGREGNPPAAIRLPDSRICVVYGYRDKPFGMRATISEDDGETWSDAIILRDDGGDYDIGYPRIVRRADGKLVTAYYYSNSPDTERYLAATIWAV